jgi:hypothetical protein
LRLADEAPSPVITTLTSVIAGPLVEQFKVVFDAHYAATIAALACVAVVWVQAEYAAWRVLAALAPCPLVARPAALAYAAAQYMAAVVALVWTQYEAHTLLYVLESGVALGLCAAAVQPFAGVRVNVDGEGEGAGDTSTSTSEVLEGGGVDLQAAAKLGFQGLRDARRAKKARAGSAQNGPGMVVRAPLMLGGWRWVAYALGLRWGAIAGANSIVHVASVVAVVAATMAVHRQTFSTMLGLAMDLVAFVVAMATGSVLLAIAAVCYVGQGAMSGQQDTVPGVHTTQVAMATVHIAVGVGSREGVKAKRRVQAFILVALAAQAVMAVCYSAMRDEGEGGGVAEGWPEVPVCLAQANLQPV